MNRRLPKPSSDLTNFALGVAVLWLGAMVDRAAAAGRVRTEVVLMTGDPAPDGNGSYRGFGTPTLNDASQALFYGYLEETNLGFADSQGLFRGTANGSPVQIVRSSQSAPDSNGAFAATRRLDFDSRALNDSGVTAFHNSLFGTSGGDGDDQGIFLGDGTSGPEQLARKGESVPNGNGNFSSLGSPTLNEAGDVAFFSGLTGTSGGSNDSQGIYRGNSSGSLIQIVRTGEPAPDGNGIFSALIAPSLNDAGEIAFRGTLTDTNNDDLHHSGIFRGDGTGAPTQIVRGGDVAPDGNGSFFAFTSGAFGPALNDAGEVAFQGSLFGTSGGGSDNRGIFRGDGISLVQIARSGSVAPDGNGAFSGFADPALNNAGQAVFFGFLTGTSGGGSDNRGIYRGDGTNGLVQIVRADEVAPDDNGSFSFFDATALNNAGQIAFLGDLVGTVDASPDDNGLFFYDDQFGLTQVARKGDGFLESTIIGLRFAGSLAELGDERSGLNNLGQIAYQFTLADGRQGIAISTIGPESEVVSGDFNGDGQVDAIDYAVWRENLGASDESILSGNGDGANGVDTGDFDLWLANYGRQGIAIATIVPEPGAHWLAMLASAAVVRRRRR